MSLFQKCVYKLNCSFKLFLIKFSLRTKGVFGDIYSSISLRFLNEFPTSYLVLQSDEGTLKSKIKELLSSRRGRSESWICVRVERLLDAAKQNPFQQTMYSSHLINLKVLISLIIQYQEHLSRLEENIDALAKEIEEYDLIQSIPGIIGNWRSRPF